MDFLKTFRNRRFKAYMPLKEPIGEYKTLEVEVYYSLGGYSYFSGATNPRGYKVGFKPVTVTEGSVSFVMMSGDPKKEGGYVGIEGAARYNAKRLKELAALVAPKIPEIVAAYEADDKNLLVALCKVGKPLADKAELEKVVSEIAKGAKVVAKAMYQKSNMKILTQEVKDNLPALYSQDGKDPDQVKIAVKFFDPTGSWTWYATEGDKTGEVIKEGAFAGEEDYRFFGYVKGFDGELGNFTLGELSVAKGLVKGLQALPIERDRNFKGTLADVMKKVGV